MIGCKFLPHALSKISRILIGILFSECSYIGLKIVSVLYSTEYCAMLKEKKLLTFVSIGQVTNADTKLCSSPRSDFLYHPPPPPPTLIFRTGYTKCLAYPRTRRPSNHSPVSTHVFPPPTVRYLRAPPPTQDINSSLTYTLQSGQCSQFLSNHFALFRKSRTKLLEGVVRCYTNY